AHFLETVGGWVPGDIEFTEARYRILKGWLKDILSQPAPSLVLRPEAFPPASAGAAPEDILHIALAYGAVIIGRMPDTLIPYVWILAPYEKNIQNPARIAYAPLASRESWTRPFLLEDMEAYLRALKT